MMARGGLTRMQAVVLLFAALSYLILLPVFYTERFALLLLPFIVLLFARFLQWRGIKKIPGRWHRYAAWAVALGVAGWAGLQSVDDARFDIATEPVEILQVRDAFFGLTSDNPRGTRLSARKPHIAHYLDMDYVPSPTSAARRILSPRCGRAKPTTCTSARMRLPPGRSSRNFSMERKSTTGSVP